MSYGQLPKEVVLMIAITSHNLKDIQNLLRLEKALRAKYANTTDFWKLVLQYRNPEVTDDMWLLMTLQMGPDTKNRERYIVRAYEITKWIFNSNKDKDSIAFDNGMSITTITNGNIEIEWNSRTVQKDIILFRINGFAGIVKRVKMGLKYTIQYKMHEHLLKNQTQMQHLLYDLFDSGVKIASITPTTVTHLKCNACGAPEPRKVCGGQCIEKARYCNVECQKRDWSKHYKMCDVQ